MSCRCSPGIISIMVGVLCMCAPLSIASGAEEESRTGLGGFGAAIWGSSITEVKNAVRDVRWDESSDSLLVGYMEYPFFYHPERLFYKPKVRFMFGPEEGLEAVEIRGFAHAESVLSMLQTDFGEPDRSSKMGGDWALWDYEDNSRLICSSPDTGLYSIPRELRIIYQSPLRDGEPVGPILEAPEVLHAEWPKLPDSFKKVWWKAQIVVDFHVNPEGRVDEAKLFQPCEYEQLNQAALKAAKKWIFEPVKSEGKDVAFKIRIPMFFIWRRSIGESFFFSRDPTLFPYPMQVVRSSPGLPG